MSSDVAELICRVCRSPGTPTNQLYHPCKCSGSMKYVHQDCLEEWLAHSRKKHCEICNFKFDFAPIYNPNTPRQISLNFFTSILIKKTLSAVKFYLRVVLAVSMWLIVLPYLTICIFRFWFEPGLLFDAAGPNPDSNTLQTLVNQSSGESPIQNFTQSASSAAAGTGGNVLVANGVITALNFTVDYLRYVARDIVGMNSTIWDRLDGVFPLWKVIEGFSAESGGHQTVTETLEESSVVIDWVPALKIFASDVFEGQILLSILIIIAIALLCIKEYIVINTPVDAAGRPINPPDGADLWAEVPADGENVDDLANPPPPPPPIQPQILRRRVPAAPVPQAAPRHPPIPVLPAPNGEEAIRRAVQRERLAHLQAMHTLQNSHQRTFEAALRDDTINGDQIISLVRETVNAQHDEEHRAMVTRAAHIAIASARQHQQEEDQVTGTYHQECIDRVREAVASVRLAENVGQDLVAAFSASIAEMGLHESRVFVEQVEKDLKRLKQRRGSGTSSTESGNETDREESVEGITRRMTRSRARNMEREEREIALNPTLNTERNEEEEALEMNKVLGRYMNVRGLAGNAVGPGDIPHEAVSRGGSSSSERVPSTDRSVSLLTRELRRRSNERNVSSDESGSSNVGPSGPVETASRSTSPQHDLSRLNHDEFDALWQEFEDSKGKGKKRLQEREPSPAASTDSKSEREGGASHGYSLRSRKASPMTQPQKLSQQLSQDMPLTLQQPPVPRLPHFSFEAPLREDPVLGLPPRIPVVAPSNQRSAQPPPDNIQLQPVEEPPVEQPAEQQPLQQPIEQRPAPVAPPPRPRRVPQQRLQRQPAAGALGPANPNQNNFNDAFNINVNVEVGPDGIAAEVQAQGDVVAFMELVGIQGPLDMLFQNFALALFIVFAALGAGGWVPFVTGRAILWLFCDVYYGVIGDIVERATKFLQVVTDPLLDPIVDGLMEVVKWSGIVTMSNFSVAAILNSTNATVVVANLNVPDAISVESAGKVVSTVPNGLKNVLDQIEKAKEDGKEIPLESVKVSIGVITGHVVDNSTVTTVEKKQQRFELVSDRVANILVGYATFLFVLYHHARRSGHLKHPYVQTLNRMIHKGIRFLFLAIKFSFFITIELGMFPTFCGLLIDLCTLPMFGPTATLSSRLVFYNAYPWTSYFLHWLAGTTFMFQFAGYVQSVRKIVRPGVVWFIRDPEDPQFHPMQDILEKPALTQIRKLAFGAMMYALVVVSTVGGYVTLVQIVQTGIGAQQGPAKFWPVKWQFSEPLSEFPIDLLIFHFLVPAVVSWIRPKELVVNALGLYFRVAAKRLRLTHFLFGERAVDEENGEVDEGDSDPVVVQVFREPEDVIGDAGDALPDLDFGETGEGNNGGGNVDIEPPNLSDTTAPVHPPARHARETPYLRVPNHDRIPLRPGQKVMVPMKRREPLTGRPDENEEDIKANWIRVYVPDHLWLRFAVMMVFQWICGVTLAVSLTIGPLYIGRLFFATIHTFFTNQPLILVPSTGTNNEFVPLTNATAISTHFSLRRMRFLPVSNESKTAEDDISGRPDLPVHDLFSLSFGLLVLIGAVLSALWIRKWVEALREHFQRVAAEREETPGTNRGLWKACLDGGKWCFEGLRVVMLNTLKALFIAFWVGIVIPALFGLVFEIYVVLPFIGDKQQTRVFFLLQDWALGAIYTKIAHSLIMNFPENELRRVIVQARDQVRQGGLHRFELRPIALKVILPIVLACAGLIYLPPFVVLLLDYMDGDGLPLEPEDELTNHFARLLIPGVLGLFVTYEVLKTARRSIKQWMDQVRDEHYLVGRRLRNIGETATNAAVAPATDVNPVVAQPGPEEEIPLVVGDDEDEWLDQID